jgi:hypothetical protein
MDAAQINLRQLVVEIKAFAVPILFYPIITDNYMLLPAKEALNVVCFRWEVRQSRRQMPKN